MELLLGDPGPVTAGIKVGFTVEDHSGINTLKKGMLLQK